MNRIKTILAALLFVTAQSSFAQKVFTEGSITYKVSVSGVTDPQAQAMMQNMMLSIYIKNDKFASVMDMGMIKTRTVRLDDNKFVMLMDMMGQKMKMTMDKKQYDSKKLNPDSYSVIVTEDTKVIAGYNCKKAIIKTKDGKSFYAYFTSDLKRATTSTYDGPYSKIDGVLMEYTMEQKGNTMTMSCTSIDFKPVSDDMFVVPESGYTEMTMDQLSKMGM
ncbi:hypothetical protein LBMAG27_02080 [Bacteroidota bacterium]|nr:hypothetical protein LBMAG27_02080 [Bacteroidota bacterium]